MNRWNKGFIYLCVTDCSHNSAVLLDLVEVTFNLIFASFVVPFQRCLLESLLLGSVPLGWGENAQFSSC